MLFVNTRPRERAQSLSDAMQAMQFTVLELPLLELTAMPFEDELRQLYQQLVTTQVIVVVSPTAVEIGFRYLKQAGYQLEQLQQIVWIAVGQATANCLLHYGVSNISIPEVETSEGMLSLPILERLDLQHIAFWRGEGGRQFMMRQLQQQGISVLNFVLYRRACPHQTLALFQNALPQLQQAEQCYVCMSSEASWLNWLNLCQNQRDVLINSHYLVLGTRLSGVLDATAQQMKCHFKQIMLDRLSPQHIQQRIMEH